MPGHRVKLDGETNADLESDNGVNYIPLVIVLCIIIVLIYLIYRLFNKVNELSNTITEMSDTFDNWVNSGPDKDLTLHDIGGNKIPDVSLSKANVSTDENFKAGPSGLTKDKVDKVDKVDKNLKTPKGKSKLNEPQLETIDESVTG
jgi:hypothetical protein